MIDLTEYKFDLPEELIARYPVDVRDESRLMIVNRNTNSIQIEPMFKNIINYLDSKDLLVYNQTRVSKRRVYLRSDSGREFETIFLENKNSDKKTWKCLVKNVRKLKQGDTLVSIDPSISFRLERNSEGDIYLFSAIEITEDIFEKIGTIPIPPYLKRKADAKDNERYQTIFAKSSGSVAAPTAGLHFTDELKSEIQKKGATFTEVELCIGYGTFSPLTEKQIQEKKLHEEEFYIPEKSFHFLNEAKKDHSKRIIAIGTTSLRTLESSYEKSSKSFLRKQGITDIFIQPGDLVESINGLITNFHLPESSLLLLVSAFAGRDLILEAYHTAIKEKMRFFSYGDAMLIL